MVLFIIKYILACNIASFAAIKTGNIFIGSVVQTLLLAAAIGTSADIASIEICEEEDNDEK